MEKQKRYDIKEVEFKGTAYRIDNKKVVKGSAYGFVLVSKKLIGKTVDIILIPHEEPTQCEKVLS